MTDHKEKALELIKQASEFPFSGIAAAQNAQAQVHATLHLADVLAQKGANQ